MLADYLFIHTAETSVCKLLKISALANDPVLSTTYQFDLEAKHTIYLALSAEEIIERYDLDTFPKLHRFLLLSAIKGKLSAYLQRTQNRYKHSPLFRIESKKWDRSMKKFYFILISKRHLRMHYSAQELLIAMNILSYLSADDVNDIVQSVRNEKKIIDNVRKQT